MKKLMFAAVAAAALWACASAAGAETFTFVNANGGNADAVILRPSDPDGRPMGAQVYGTKTSATFADGKKAETAARCSTWILPPGDQFGQTGVCEYKDAAGPLYESRYTCAAPAKGATGVDCWGTLTGTGGAWKGRSGAFTLHTGQGSARGEGHWNE